jgi:hypothetical protein
MCGLSCQLPELTPYGRLFKLSGYTLGTTQLFPVAVMAVGSVSKVSNTQGNDSSYPRNNQLQLEGQPVHCGQGG